MFNILNQVSFVFKKLAGRYFHFFLLGNLLLAGELPGAQSTNFSQNAWTNDLSAGIAPSLHYTHAVKFGWYAPSVVINEVNVNREGGPTVARGAKNYVELLVVQDGLNLSGMVLRDFTENWTTDSSTSAGWFTFKDVPLWKNLPAGTLIVLSTDPSSQRLTRDGEYLWVYLFDSNYFTWGGNFDIESRDMVMIKDGSTQPNAYRPNPGPVTGVLGSLHVVQGGRSDGDSDDPLLSFVELANSAISLITVEGIVASLAQRWLNWDDGWGSTFDLIDGKDIRWSQIASAKLGGEDSPNYNSFNGDYAVKNSTGTLSDYNGFNDGSKVSSGAWYQHTLGQPNNTNNQAFINALRATRRGVETSIPSWDRRRGELITSVNGLSLSRFKDINPSGGNFSTVGLGGMCENNGTKVSGAASSGELSRGFLFGTGTEVLHLTGLTPGRAYVASLFSVGAGAPGTHWQTISTSSLNGAGSYRFDQNAFGLGQGIRIDIRYVADSLGTASFQIDPDNSRNSFHLYGFVNRVENLRQWINFPSLPDVVAGQTLDLAVGNIFATYQNTNNPRPGETGWFALCTADGEGTLHYSLGTGLPISLTSSDTNVATIGNAITSGGIGGAALGYWVTPRAAGTTILTATAAGNGIYGAATPVSLTLNVRPNANAVVTLTVPTNLVYDGTGKSYGARVQNSEEFTYSYTGTGSTGYGPSTNSPTRAGTYSVTATSTNPSFPVSKTATFTIERASNSFTFDSLPVKTMGDAPFALTPVQTTGGAPITFTSSNTNVATVSGSTVTLVGAGQTVITASQSNLPGFEDYVVASSQAQTLYVRATQTISFGALAPKVVNSGAFALTATASSGLAVSYQSSNTNVARVTGSTVTLLAPGTTVITASQEGSPTTFAAASNVSQTLTVIPQPLSAEDVSFQGPANLGYDGTAKGYTAQAGFVAKIAAGGFNSAAILKNGTVVVWGDPSYGKCDPPAGLNAVEKLSVGGSHILAMQGPNQGSSGTRSGGYKLVAWGSDSYGKVSIFQGARVFDIAAGREHTVVQSARGTVESCGLGEQGQCDFGWFDYVYAESWGATNRPYLSNGQQRMIQLPKVYAGPVASYALLPATDANLIYPLPETGKVEACGARYEGGFDYPPEVVPADLTGVMDLAVGGTFVIALRNRYVPFHWPTNDTDVAIDAYYVKTVSAWGWMNYVMPHDAWVPSTLGTNVIAIAAGYEHALALRTNGTVVGWGGGNYYRQNSIPAGLTNVVAIASGYYHNLALKSDGTVGAWGDNGWGQTTLPASRLGVTGFAYLYTGKAGSATTYGPSTNAPTQGGSYTVTATPTDPYYSGAVSRDFTITSATLSATSITINSLGSLIYSGTPKTHTATSPGVSGFTLSYSGVNATAYGPSPIAPTNVGDYEVTATSSDPSWSGSKTQAFSIAPASLGSPDIISLNPSSSLEYSRTPKTRTATVEGISNFTYSYAGVSPTVYGPSGTAPTDVGAYAVTVTATSADGNYATSKTFSFGITPKPVSVIANAATKFFGSTDPVFTYAVSGLVAPDGLTGSLSRASGENVGTYDILLGSLSAGPNYTLSFTGATLTIGGAPIFSILPPASLAYDGNPKAFTAAPYQVRAIAAGPNRTLAVLMNGGVVSWGTILSGTGAQSAYTLELVPPDLNNAVAVAAGSQFSLALRSDGTIRAWGTEITTTRNQSILNPPANDGSWSSYQRPFFDSYNGINEISAGTYHAVALKKRDSYYPDYPKTWAWGSPGDGATGKDANGYYTYSGFNNTLGYSEAFGWMNVKAIAAGFWYTLVVREDGRVQAYGSVTNLAPPADLTNAIAVAAGFQHALAIRTNGTVVAWGSNLSGQTNVPAGLSGVIAVAGGRDHSLALRTNGTVVAWGGNSVGQASVPAGLNNVTAIAAGDFHSVALKSDGTVVAWGGNSSGQRNVPAALQPGTPVFTFVYAGRGTTVYGPSATPPSQGGTYTVTVTSSSSDPSMNFANTGSRDFTIEGALLSPESISIGPLSRDYDGTGQGVTATAPGVSGFTYSYAGVSPTVYPASSTPPTQAGSYQVTASSSDPNWSGSKIQSFTILPAALDDANLTLTAPADLEYNGTPKEFTAAGAFLLRVTYSGIGSTGYPSSSSAPTQAGTYSVTVRTPTEDPNYERTKSAIFSITPRPVTITAQPKSKAYGAADPALTYLKSGFLGSDQPTGSLSRAAGESLGTYAIVQGTLSPGPNYILQSFIGASFTIGGVNSLAPGSIPFFSGVDLILPVAPGPFYNVMMGGLAHSGENKVYVHAPAPNSSLATYQFGGTNLTIQALAESARDYGQLTCSGNRLYGRAGGQIYWINPGQNRSDQLVTVDPAHPLIGDGRSLFNLPDGRLGVAGEVAAGQFTVRLYTVSADGLTLTRSQDFTLYDGWNPAGAGFACDGTYFYKLSRSEGYKSYTLATGQVAFDGTDWRPPAGFNSSDNPTYMARNHLTGQFIIADTFYSRKVMVSVNLEADTRLTAPTSLVYDGNPKNYTVAGSWLQAVYEGRGSTAYGPTTNAPAGTGTYRVKVAAKDANFELGNVNVADFTITPATMGLGLTPPASLVYDGNPKAYTASATNPAAGTFIYTYAGRGDTFYGPSAIAPNNVGTYRVSATTANASNFTDGLLETDFAITPATLSLAPPTSFAYSGTAKSYTTTLSFLSGVNFSYSGRESTIYGPTTVAPTIPGSYRVTATVPSSGNYLISGSLTADFAITSITVGSTPWAPLQVSSDTVLPLAGSATIVGLACDGTNYYVNRGGTAVLVYRPDGSLISSNPVSNLRADNNQMAFAGGYLFARKDSQLYRISTNDWSSSLVTVDASYPLLSAGSYMSGSLFDTPDGKIGVMGPVIGGAFKVRMYTVSSNGLTLTWNRDYTVNDTWAPDEHGTACDGTFLYRMCMTTGYKSYRLTSGTVAYNGTGWTKPSAIVNPTFVARNHRTGQILVGDYRGSRLIVSSASPQMGLLAPASLVFDGNPKECEVARIGSLDYTFTYRGVNLTAYGPSSTAPVNAGDYLFTVTAPDSAYIAPDPLAFTIQPAVISSTSIILTAPSLIYNGDGKAYTASATGVTGFTYTYTGRAGTSYGPSTVAPTDAGSYTVTASINDANYTGMKSLDFAIAKATPTITSIPTTSAISYGQSLTSSSLSSGTGSVPGVFAFNTPNTTPSAGTSNHTVTFTPADTVNYNPVSCTVGVTVNPGVLNSSNIAFTAPANLVYSGTQKAFTATAPGISTDFAYSYRGIDGTSYGPTSTPPTNPGNYAVTATVTNPNYTGSATQSLTITKATPSITWATPASIRDGTALSASQLNATASVAGSFVYSPPSGTTLATGAHALQVSFTPTDTANYNSVSASVSLLVYSPSPSFSLIAPPSLNYDGTAKTYAVSQMSRIAAGLAHSLAIKADGTVVAWGSNSDGQTSVPANLSGVTQVAAGYYHSLALKADGSVVGWGANNENQRANIQGSFAPFTGYSSLSPLALEPPAPAITNGIAVAGGGRLSLVLKVDGTVVAIGKKDNGSAMPTTQDHALTVPAGLIGVTAIAAGWDHALALKSDGTVVAWDGNQYGESTVPDGLSGVVAIAAGQDHSIALKSDGTVVAWGRNNFGQCTVPSSVANVVAITCGDYESYALKRDGSVLYWGSLGSGQAVSSGSGVIAISAGGAHLLMLKSDGSLAAWGSNNSGQASIPAAVATGVGNFAYSYSYTGRAGTVYAANSSAPVNPGSYRLTVTSTNPNFSESKTVDFTIAKATPTLITQPMASIITEGQALSAASISGGSASVNGTFSFSAPTFVPQAGASTQSLTFTPTDLVNYNTVTTSITVLVQGANAATPTINLAPSASAITFGQQLGSSTLSGGSASVPGTFVFSSRLASPNPGPASQSVTFIPTDIANYKPVTFLVPVTVYDGIVSPLNIALTPPPSLFYDGKAKAFRVSRSALVSAGSYGHVLVVKSDGTVSATSATGDNSAGQINVPAGLSGVVAVAAGSDSSMALKSDGTVVEWGASWMGRAPTGLTGVVAIARGTDHALALKSNGTVVAWGYNGQGQTNVPAGLANVVGITASGSTSYALKSDGTVVAWGGQPTIPNGLSGIIAINASSIGGVVALKADGTVVAWGFEGPPEGLSDVVAVAAGRNHRVALKSDGTVVAWGAGTTFTESGSHGNLVPWNLSNVVAIAASSDATYTIRADGSVVWWGQRSSFGAYRVNKNGVFEVYRTSSGSAVAVPEITPILPSASAGFSFSTSYEGRDGTSYASSTTAPTNPGNYRITATGTDPDFPATKTLDFTIQKRIPTILNIPNPSLITYGQRLADSTLDSGIGSVAGTFAWSNPATAPNAGTASYAFTFTPADTTNYQATTGTVNVTVGKAIPVVTHAPTASEITYGQTLASSTLTGGVAAAGVTGTFGFTIPSTAPNAGTRSQEVTFTPTDSDNYNSVTTTVNVTVNKATLAGVTWPSASAISRGQALSEATLTGGSGNGTFAFTTPLMVPNAGPFQSFNVMFTPADADNYSILVAPVSVTVDKVTPTILTVPTATSITYGQTLADSTLMGGLGSVSGGFAWVNADSAPDAGTAAQDFVTSQAFVFVPDDTMNYDSVIGSVRVEVSKAVATVALDNLSADYDGTPKVVSVTTTPPGLLVNVTYNGQSSAPVEAGSYEVLATIDDANYAGSKSMIQTIAPKTVTVTAAAKSKEYGEEDPELTYLSSGLLGSDVFTGSLVREPGESAGTYAITQGSLSAGGNYTIDYVGAVFTITAAALPEVAWNVFPPASLEYDGTAKTFMALAGGAGPSQYSSTVFTYLYEGQNGTSYAATDTAPTQVGDYRLTTTASGNYTGTKQTDFAITPKLLTVSGLTAVSRAYDGTRDCSLTGTPAYDGLVTGEEFAVLGTPVATFATAQAGTNKVVSVSGLEAPTANYQVTQPSLLADITKATLIPAWSGATSVVFDGNSHALTASTTPVTSVSVTYDGSAMPPTQVGIYTVVATVLDDNYEGSASSSLQIQAKSVTSWAEEFGLSGADAAPSVDPDGDGLNNATEFAFGTNPTIGGGGKTCEMLPVDSGTVGVTFFRRISSAEATYQARVFTDLSAGFSSGTLLTPLRSADQTGVPSGYERVEVQAPTTGERGFIQIKATVP